MAATQSLLQTLIAAPEGVAEALRQHPGITLPVKARGSLSAEARVQIYANMYFWRLHDALVEDFAIVRRYCGEHRFAQLVRAYVRVHAPTSYTLRHLGQHFAHFLESQAILSEWPFLAEVAHFEWHLLNVFDAPDAEPLSESALRAIPIEAWPALRFQLIPAHAVLACTWRVDEIFDQLDHDDGFQRQGEEVSSAQADTGESPLSLTTPIAPPRRDSVTLLLWRHDDRVYYRPIDAVETMFLQHARTGTTLEALCDCALSQLSAADAATRIHQWFGHSVQAGLLMNP